MTLQNIEFLIYNFMYKSLINSFLNRSYKELVLLVWVFGMGDIMTFGMGKVMYPYHLKYYFRYNLLIYRLFDLVWGIWYARSKYPFQIWFRTGYAPIYIIGAIPVLNHNPCQI